MESEPSMCVVNVGLVGFYHPNFDRWHRPVVCGVVSGRYAVMSATNLVPGFTDPVVIKLPLGEGEKYEIGPSFLRPMQNWPFGLAMTYPEHWPPV